MICAALGALWSRTVVAEWNFAFLVPERQTAEAAQEFVIEG
jgi:hypothetical protein